MGHSILSEKKVIVEPEKWIAVDMLGRKVLPREKASLRGEKQVGLFYWTWHYSFAERMEARNVTEIIAKNPEAVNDFSHECWENTPAGTYYHWDEPLFGYYQNLDGYVLRKHAEMIADAGVDVIIFDNTNGAFTWRPAYLALCKAFKKATEDGVNVPKIAFMLNFAPLPETKAMIYQIYDDIYADDEYECLWYYREGKPLIMAYKDALDDNIPKDREIKEFFTFKKNEPTYFAADTRIEEQFWGWCSVYPQTKFGVREEDGTVEQMTVNVAQNANDNGLNAMNCNGGAGTYGRSYAKGDYSYSYKYGGKNITVDGKIEKSYLYGLNFQQQWDYALEVDPDFVFVTGWNEWVAGRQPEWLGTVNAFPDQYDYEHSRDIEPSKGVLKDAFYYQLAANVRRFKGGDGNEGLHRCDTAASKKSVDIYGEVSAQWSDVEPAFAHYRNSTLPRDAEGWKGLRYKGEGVRNDVIMSKAAYDNEYVYFAAECAEEISPCTDGEWMRLFIMTDFEGILPSWEGIQYIINRNSPEGGVAAVEKSVGGFNWEKTGEAEINVCGTVLQLKVPREALGFEKGESKPDFAFKWADGNIKDGDVLEFYTKGEAAPGGRFMFCF